jgi:hypothetical protein
MRENQLQGPWEEVDPENRDFLGPEMATSETHVHTLQFLGPNGICFTR